MTAAPLPATVKAHLHATDQISGATFVTALIIAAPAPDVIINGEHIYRRHEEHSVRLRRPVYVRATYAITGPVARRASMTVVGGGGVSDGQ
jgi:hypothetical protein